MQRGLSLIGDNTARNPREIPDRFEDVTQDRIDLFHEKIRWAFLPHPHPPHRSNRRGRYNHPRHNEHLIPINKLLDAYTDLIIKGESNEVWMSDVRASARASE